MTGWTRYTQYDSLANGPKGDQESNVFTGPPFPVAHANITQHTHAPHTVLFVALYRAETPVDNG